MAPRLAYLRQALTLNDHPAFKVTYDNVGKQPALNTFMLTHVSIIAADLLARSLNEPKLAESVFGQNPTCDGNTSHKGGGIIWPSTPPATYSESSVENPNDPTPIITQQVIDGSAALVIQGCLFYETFQEVHHSAFCFYFRQVPPFLICPIGNDAN